MIAYDTSTISKSARAAKWRLSRRQLSRFVKSVAFSYLRMQDMVIDKLVRFIQSLPRYRFTLTDNLCFDETSQRLYLKLGKSMLGSHSSQAPHVFIALRQLVIDFIDSDSDSELFLNWVSNPCATLSTTSGALLHILTGVKGLGSHHDFNSWFSLLMDCAEDTLCCRSIDGASSNLKLFDHEVRQALGSLSMFHLMHHCFFHGNNITATVVSTSCFKGMQEGLFCVSKLINMGAHFLRILYSIPPVIRSLAVFMGCARPDDNQIWRDVSRGIISLVSLHHKRGMVMREMYVGVATAFKPSWVSDLVWMFDFVFTGPLNDSKQWKHFCLYPGCCPEGEISMIKKFIVCALRILQRCRPGVPCLSRWTSTGPALDYYVLNMLTGKVCRE